MSNVTRCVIAAVVSGMLPILVLGASIEPKEFAALLAHAKQNGAAPVEIEVTALSLAQLHANPQSERSALVAKNAKLAAELEGTTWDAGKWDNGLGHLGLMVTEEGLNRLRASSGALSFRAGSNWQQRSHINNEDGRLTALEQIVSKDGTVDALVVLNVEGLQHRLSTTAGTTVYFLEGGDLAGSAAEVASRIAATLDERHVSGLAKNTSISPAGTEPTLRLRLTRQGLIKLSADPNVRTILPLGFSDSRKFSVPAEVAQAAVKDGSADVLLSIRTGDVGGQLSKRSLVAATKSNDAIITDVLTRHALTGKVHRSPMFGLFYGRLTAAEIRSLESSPHPALLGISLNKPMGGTLLATANSTTNVLAAYNAGFRGKDQNIIVMDSGVRRDHVFLSNNSNGTRVLYEACFGVPSLTTSAGVTYESVCPNKDSNGDQKVNAPGVAAAVPNCAAPEQGLENSACIHGTHVAGIAAGKPVAGGSAGNIQGVAPEANIVAVQVFSFDTRRYSPPVFFFPDVADAMATVAGAMANGLNPHIVNLSLGTADVYSGNCNSSSTNPNDPVNKFENAVLTLKNFGVPVVAATGNGNSIGVGYNNGISWPACVSNVIKVASVNNDGIGYQRATSANVGNPFNYTGDFFFAPGGGVWSSASTSATSLRNLSGTSQAAPQIAGAYALIKQANPLATVDGASAWLRGSAGSIPIGVSLCTGCPDTQFRRLRITTP